MIRLGTGFIVIVAVAVAAVWVADRPGRLVLDWEGLRIETSAAVAGLALAAVWLASLFVYRLWRTLRQAPRDLRRRRAERRRHEGYLAFARGMVAIAAGDARSAAQMARKAERLLPEPTLPLLLSAHAAQLGGDAPAAESHFTAMLQSPETELLGLRGLLAAAQAANDRPRALELARRAVALRADAPWALAALFDLQAAMADWAGAEATVALALKAKAIGGADAARRRAVLHLARARAAADANDAETARTLAASAVKLAPDLVPAAVLLASGLRAAGKARKAAKTLRAAWARAPHPDLADEWRRLHQDDLAPRRLQAMRDLAALNPDHPESRLLKVRAALDTADWSGARAELEGSGLHGPRALRLLAELDEKQYGDEAGARSKRALADASAPEAAWICRRCGRVAREWSPTCPGCESFDSLQWAVPPALAPLMAEARPALPAASPQATAKQGAPSQAASALPLGSSS